MSHGQATEDEALTRPEQLLIRRLKAGLTQTQAAEVYRIAPRSYGAWERSERLVPYEFKGRPVLIAHEREIGELHDHHACTVLRNRLGLTQEMVAAAVGCSRWTVIRAEAGEHAKAAREIKLWLLSRIRRKR